MRNRFKFLGIIVLTAVIGFSMSACNNPTGADDRYRNGGGWGGSGGQEQPGVITWTAHPSGSPATNAIYIFFSRDPGSLSAGDFAITPAGGSATRGALSGSGITRRLAVSNVDSGAVSVSVNASNISGSKTVTLFAPGEGEAAAITWTAAPAGSPTTTYLTFNFGSDPGPLQASNFTITAGSGSAARGALSGSGTTRTLMISNVREGSVSVLINAPNIAGGSSLVTLVQPAITWTVTPFGSPATNALDFTFSRDPGSLWASDFTITAGSGSATRGTLSGTGTTRRLAISNVSAGNVTVSISASGISGSQNVTLVNPAITWTLVPFGSPATNALDFTFSRDPGFLAATAFTITAGSGSATRGALTGSGITRRLAVSNVSAGTVTVSISAPGISGSQTVTLVAPAHFYFDPATGTITGYSGPRDGHLTIPASIGGVPVTRIGWHAFNQGQFTSVTIPDSVTHIDGFAFNNNNLTSLTIPNNVTRIGAYAFNNNNLTSLTIPNNVTHIEGGSAFANNQLTSVTIGNSVTTIGARAFYNNRLTSVTIPNSVISIGNFAFENNQLTSVTIGNSVRAIEGRAFNRNQLSNVIIPNSVTSIGDSAFENNQLTSVTIGNSVSAIGGSAFRNNRLTSVTIPNSVTSIGDSAFENNQLTSVTIPNSVVVIREAAFANNQLSSVTIHHGVLGLTIANRAFQQNQLTSITIRGNVGLPSMSFPSSGFYAFPGGFDSFYINGGRLAGTYTRPNATSWDWTRH